jgi:hypothetical protein
MQAEQARAVERATTAMAQSATKNEDAPLLTSASAPHQVQAVLREAKDLT